MGMEITKIRYWLEGLADIMFDRFIDHSSEKRPPEQKLYLSDGNRLMLPSENIDALLWKDSAPLGCARTFEGKQGKEYRRMGMSHVFIDPPLIPFMANGKELIFDGFDEKRTKHESINGKSAKQLKAKMWIHEGAPITKGIKQEFKQRPVLKLPWSLTFDVTIVKNTMIDATKLLNWFTMGGMQIALGTYRPKFGRFSAQIVE